MDDPERPAELASCYEDDLGGFEPEDIRELCREILAEREELARIREMWDDRDDRDDRDGKGE